MLVNGLPVKTSKKLRVNDLISIRLPELPDKSLPAENLPLEILYEDDVMVVINKAAGMIVHPGRGHYRGTMAGALQFHFDSLSDVAGQMRPGIVHRLDRDTSGIVVVAKTNQIHNHLSGQFERREVNKEYHAIVHGVIDRDSDYIDTYIGIDPRSRVRMCVRPQGGDAREANTFYQVLERFADYTYVRLLPKTGRTHQLRVHMRHLGHPIVADRIYGGREPIEFSDVMLQNSATSGSPIASSDVPASVPENRDLNEFEFDEITDLELVDSEAVPDETLRTQESLESPVSSTSGMISRQALHAHRLQISHPVKHDRIEFVAPLPADMQRLLQALRGERTPS